MPAPAMPLSSLAGRPGVEWNCSDELAEMLESESEWQFGSSSARLRECGVSTIPPGIEQRTTDVRRTCA